MTANDSRTHETRPDCECGHPARYHINFAHEGKPVPPGPPEIPRKENFCRHPTPRSFCACRNYVATTPVGKDSNDDELLCNLLAAYGRLMFDGGTTGTALERPRAFYDVLKRVRELVASPVGKDSSFEELLQPLRALIAKRAEGEGEEMVAALSRYVEQLKAENAQLRERVRGAIEVLQDPYAVFQGEQINSALARLRSTQGDTAQ